MSKNEKFKLSPFVEAIRIRAKYFPEDRAAIIYGQDEISWKTLYSRTCKLANGFRSLGIKRQEKVAFIFHNTPEFLEINFALQMLGAVPVPFNYRYVGPEIEYTVNNSDAVCLIIEEDILEETLRVKDQLTKVKHFIIKASKKVEGFLDYEELLNSQSDKEKYVSITDDDLAVIIYTGGTTGRSKGVMLSYKNVLSNQEAVVAFLINSLPKVSKRKLASENFVKIKPYSKVFLTAKGKLKAEKMFDSHYTIKRFMKHILKHNEEKADEESHKISHLLSEETIKPHCLF